MKFIADQQSLSAAAAWVAKALPNRPTAPILGAMKVTVRPDAVTLAAFDYDVSLTTTVEVMTGDSGTFAVPGGPLREMLASLPHGQVQVDVDTARATLRCGGAVFTLPLMPVEDYPALPEVPAPDGHFPGQAFAQAATQTKCATSRDETVPILCAVRIDVTGRRGALAATDRYRLTCRRLEWTPAADPVTYGLLVRVPALEAVCAAIGSSANPVQMAAVRNLNGDASMVAFTVDERIITCRVIDEAYIKYEERLADIGERDHSTEVMVEVAPLTAAVKRASLVLSRNQPVKIAVGDETIGVQAAGDDSQLAEPLAAHTRGEHITVAINHAYLLDALAAMPTEEVRMQFGKATQPIMCRPVGGTDYRHVLMPIRLA
ncbi:DNA polymerase III subunit beta [Planobispora siamensis]|uniref:DNA polymerase III subunit beta n=1 Tax=Planobispora siamensis TaxID=936338 RepID=A0A8J3SMY8_9ACTN|nr:DNA polymerase III subunit beta [Planobispora siamensis]GIH95410.1 DNA polymerase III subunit beta [Planobispora siamensis]